MKLTVLTDSTHRIDSLQKLQNRSVNGEDALVGGRVGLWDGFGKFAINECNGVDVWREGQAVGEGKSHWPCADDADLVSYFRH